MRENKYKKSINGTGGKEQPHDVSSSGHFKEQSESLEKNGEFEAVEAKNFYELFMNLDVGAIEQQEKSLIDQVDKLVKHLEDMVSTGRAELFLACDIDRGAFFSYFRQALQNKQPSLCEVRLKGKDGHYRLFLVHAAREPKFADYTHDVRTRMINWVLQQRRHNDPLLHRWAVEVVVSHVWDAVLTWLDVGDPARDEEFAWRCNAGVIALWMAYRPSQRTATQC